MMSTRTHPYHTITLNASQSFIDDVTLVLEAWVDQCDMSVLHSSVEYPPESEPIYRITVPAEDSDGIYSPVEFMLALVYDCAHRIGLPDPKVSSSTTWHPDELQPGNHATDVQTAELLETGSYEFIFRVPVWYPLDLFDYIVIEVMDEKALDEPEFASESIWMPDDGHAIQLTIFGRPALNEPDFERSVADAITGTLNVPYLSGWLAESYEDDDDDGA